MGSVVVLLQYNLNMKLLILFSTLLVAAMAQFNQGGFFNSPQRRQTQPGRRNVFLRFDDDDFDDFFDDDDDDDSLEDLYEDLYDDDAHDRAQARAALTRLRASGAITGNSFRNNRGSRNNGFRTSNFNNNGFGTSNFNNNGFRTSNFNNNGFASRFPSNSRSSGFNSNNRFGTNNRASNSNNRFATNSQARTSSFNNNRVNRFPTNSHFGGSSNINNGFGRPLSSTNPFTTKRSSGSTFPRDSLNAIPGSSDLKSTSSSSSSSSSSPFKSFNSNINRLGGNGYFFSMKTHGSEPITYFIRYDD
ncbi:putative uncharacterized protein DDB_G0286901 isoform X3 [Penaeus japonicus]|uniref:putative uncharacterized protein DDB_G0286901 isoform X3 n=1 Tax=Penaeus japonicus TaxID=27405 RepID=UPI001C70C1A3|nr:putative uncharacterized protein DDB_G0286901 isoform X3 [Penaeus japonicus]